MFILLFIGVAFANCVHNLNYWQNHALPQQTPSSLCGVDRALILSHESEHIEFYFYSKQYLATSANFYSTDTNKNDLLIEQFIDSPQTLECFTERETLLDEYCGQYPMQHGSEPHNRLLECSVLLSEFNEGRHTLHSCPGEVEMEGEDNAENLFREAIVEGVNVANDPEIVQAHKAQQPGVVVAATVVIIVVVVAMVGICAYWNPINLLDR